MNQQTSNRSPGFIRMALATVALAALSLAGIPHSASAATQGSAGNTIIRNRVTVNYNDAGGVAQAPVTSQVDITVTTVNVAPTILSITPSPGSTDGTGNTQAYSVVVRTNSNGPGTINLSAGDNAGPTNLTLSGTGPSLSAATMFLGSTIIDPTDAKIGAAQNVANGASITFNVPNDGGVPTDSATTGGSTGDGVVNGLTNGDTVYLYSGTTYSGPFTVTGVTGNAVGAGTTAAFNTITLQNSSGAAAAFTPAYGWQIVEAKTVTVTVTQGVVTNPLLPASWVTTITGSMGGQNGTGTVTTNASSGKLTVTKYVRNVTVPVVGATPVTPPINGGGATFYQTGVSGKPGDIMEYLYVIQNTGTGVVNAVVATDPVPTYTTLYSSSAAYGVNNTGGATGTFAVARRTGNGVDQSLKVDNSSGNNATAWGKSTGITAGSTMTYYLGNNSANNAGGTIAASEIAYVIYRLKID